MDLPKEYAKSRTVRNVFARLDLNVNPLGASPAVITALHSLSHTHISHYFHESHELLHALTEYTTVDQSHIMLADGCDGCIEMIAKSLLNEGDVVLIPTPTFHRYEIHARNAGATCMFCSFGDIEIHIKKCSMVFICNPNNPSGEIISLERIAQLAQQFDGIIVLDEALAEFAGIDYSCLVHQFSNIIIARSFSKMFGIPGLRIGYTLSTPQLTTTLKQSSSPFKVNAAAQMAAIAALHDKDHFEKTKHFVKEQITHIKQALNLLNIPHSQSLTSNLYIDLTKYFNSSEEATEYFERKGILVTNGISFRPPQGVYIRISVGKAHENQKFLKTLKEYIDLK